jgi:phosphomevalonate kinase
VGVATVSAPGKVFVVGEYGVAHGGPAVVAAVDRRIRCRIRWGLGAGCLTIRRAGCSFTGQLAQDEVASAPPELRFAVGAALVAARAIALEGVDLEIDIESELGDAEAGKVGLGGSAAVTAAVVAAVHAAAGDDLAAPGSIERRTAVGIYSHRLAQGSGSAADVVAATAGGLSFVEGLDAEDCPASVAACVARLSGAAAVRRVPLELPPPLTLELVATGRAARSGPRIARFSELRSRRGGRAVGPCVLDAWSAGTAAAVREFRAGCEAREPARVLRAMRFAGKLLERLGPIAGIPIATPELRRACGAAASSGAAVKISGAGGGDCAVAAVSREHADGLRRAWRAAGVTPLGVAISQSGVLCEAELGGRVGTA